MGVLTDVFVAGPDEVALAEGGPTVTPGHLEAEDMKSLDLVMLATLGELLDGEYDSLLEEIGEPIHVFDPEAEWVWLIPGSLTATLAGIPDGGIREVAARWAKTEEWQRGPQPERWALAYLRGLVRLARSAVRTRKNLYVWSSL